MKLWDKGTELHEAVERFTVGDDPVLDRELVEFDCRASTAHARMLEQIGVLEHAEADALVEGLAGIADLHAKGEFQIRTADEDCHTAIENHLIETCGQAGKKLHLGRSRNDQVLVALRLYEKDRLGSMLEQLDGFAEQLAAARARHGDIRLPGYTHTRRAMPTTVGIWLGCFEDSAADNRALLSAVGRLIDQNPLGTAAGFGVPVFELDREMTTRALGFARVQANPLYAQLSRGKFEMLLMNALLAVLLDLNKLASDLILFSTREFGFVLLPESLCTGSSIMPQKKNPDVLELVRAKYHQVMGESVAVQSTIGNLMSGYNRDLQLTKGPMMRALACTRDCLGVMGLVVSQLQVDPDRCETALTDEVFATERAYQLVSEGVPFREAYRQVAQALKDSSEG